MSLGAPGFDSSLEVELKSTVNWRAVRLDVARVTWGAIVRSLVMVDVLDVELGRIIEVIVPSIKVRRCGVFPVSLGIVYRAPVRQTRQVLIPEV